MLLLLAAAVGAQVYRGETTVADPGDPTMPPFPRPVAVKVIHPDVKSEIEMDLELLRGAGEGGGKEAAGHSPGRRRCGGETHLRLQAHVHDGECGFCDGGAAWLAERGGYLQWWSLREFVEEFAGIMNMQLDLTREAVRQPHTHAQRWRAHHPPTLTPAQSFTDDTWRVCVS